MPHPERRLVIDRFEGETAVVEVDGGAPLDLPRWLLPAGAAEGAVVLVARASDGETRLRLDLAATEAASADARDRLARLAAGDLGGDVVL